MTDKIEVLGFAFLALGVLTIFNLAMLLVIGNRLSDLINYCTMLRQYTAQIAEHVNYTNGDDDDPDDGEPAPVEDDNIVQFDRKRAWPCLGVTAAAPALPTNPLPELSSVDVDAVN